MSGDIGAAGDLATGVLVARAVEPHAGESVFGTHAQLCLNCGTALRGDFCHACGQTGHVHRTLVSIGHDLLHGVFHFEGKVWRTLPMLVARPGELTRRYIAGERARFVSPLALFLFSVFLMFAVLHSSGADDKSMAPAERGDKIAKLDRKLKEERRELAQARANGTPYAIASLSKKIRRDEARRADLVSGKPEAIFDLSGVKSTGWFNLDKGLAKANANPGLAWYKFQSSAYKYSWALIPISVPFVTLLFLWRRGFKLYDHAIFITYSLSFMMALIVMVEVGSMLNIPGWLLQSAVLVAPPIHMFAQLRGAYGLRKRSALWRTVLLLVFAGFALLMFGAMLLVMGLMD